MQESIVRFNGRGAYRSGYLADHFGQAIKEAIVRGDSIRIEWPLHAQSISIESTTVAAKHKSQSGFADSIHDMEIKEAIVRVGSIRLECPSQSRPVSIELTDTGGGKCEGRSVFAAKSSNEAAAKVWANLYTNGIVFVLVGEEDWKTQMNWFIIELSDGRRIGIGEEEFPT